MLNKVIHKFYLIGAFLALTFVIGYALLAFFLHNESRSAMRGHEAVMLEREIHSLEDMFLQTRFWEKAVLAQSHPEAEKKFGALMERMNHGLRILRKKQIERHMQDGLEQISNLIMQYEKEFSRIIQLKTEQRLGQTLFDSNYQSLVSNVLGSNEIDLVKPLFNLSYFQTSYISNHRQSELQALKVVIASLEHLLLRTGLMDNRLRGYTETYKAFLDDDFSLETEIQELSDRFDEITSRLTSHFERIAEVANGILETERRTAEDLRNRLNQSFVISMVLGTLGILFLFVFVTRQIVHPIGGLAEIARKVRSGDIEARFVPKGNRKDEVVELGLDLNEMLDTLKKRNQQLFSYQKELENKIRQLAQREDELKQHRDHLEELVDERTRKLEAAQEELIRKERLATLGQLTAVVSHELRNPLGTIRSSLFALRERVGDGGPGVERAMDRAERNITRCDGIIEDLLDYTRLRDLHRESTLIDEWLGELLDDHATLGEISVVRDLAAGVRILVDPERLRRCVINVVDNATEAMMSKGGPEGVEHGTVEGEQLTVRTRVKGHRLEIQAIDTGPGIPAENLERIFEPLYSTKSFGAGLGLPIVKQIMEQHDGGVEIKNEPGKGAAVTLWLPIT